MSVRLRTDECPGFHSMVTMRFLLFLATKRCSWGYSTRASLAVNGSCMLRGTDRQGDGLRSPSWPGFTYNDNDAEGCGKTNDYAVFSVKFSEESLV